MFEQDVGGTVLIETSAGLKEGHEAALFSDAETTLRHKDTCLINMEGVVNCTVQSGNTPPGGGFLPN